MSRDLLNFVRDRNGNQSQPNPPTTKYLENRRAIAEGTKIRPKTTLGQTLQAIPQYRPVSPIPIHFISVQSRQHHDSGELGAFAETTLGDDSDDTTVDSVCGEDGGDNPEYQQSQQDHKIEELLEDEFTDEEGIEGGDGNLKHGEKSWNQPVTRNSPFQPDRRFQTFPERSQISKLSASQQATIQNLRHDPKFAQILVKKDKDFLHNNPNKNELPSYAQSRTGRFETTTDWQYSSHQQMYTGQNGMTDGRIVHPQRQGFTVKEPRALENGNTEQTVGRVVGDEPELFPPRSGLLDDDLAQLPVVGTFDESYESSSRESSPSERTPKAKRPMPSSAPVILGSVSTERAALEPDYDKSTLFRMEYSELKEQAFDDDPKAVPLVIPSHLIEPNCLSDRLEHFASLGRDAQTRFFAQMPKDEWDKSGDWFIERFADIMSKLRDSRQAKRDISKAFEDELAAREEALRSKSGEIDETLRAMKQGGESVLKGSII